MLYLGLDIGTTSICAVVTDSAGTVLFCKTTANDSGTTVQNPLRILELCTGLLNQVFAAHTDIAGIGVCGQMHGMLYLNASGEPVSPLYTWQDESGNAFMPDGRSYAQALRALTGYAAASGFGCTTLFVHSQKGQIPEGAAQICTVHDYVAMHMCGLARPVMHTSDAASFGLFDLERQRFDSAALRAANLPEALIPEVVADYSVLGTYRDVPVTVAIGDNQASFLGAAELPERTVLVNVGTGSQCSLMTAYLPPSQLSAAAEIRPLCAERFLYVGSALCGGRAFALLKDFFAQCALLLGQSCSESELYSKMDQILKENPQPEQSRLQVDTRFAGTRQDPALRGSITGLGVDNFTPVHLLWGVVDGIAEELYSCYAAQPIRCDCLVGAGNGLRKNTALRQAVERRFGMPLHIPQFGEEAARGAAKAAAHG